MQRAKINNSQLAHGTRTNMQLANQLVIRSAQTFNSPNNAKKTKLKIKINELGLLRCYVSMKYSELNIDQQEPIFMPYKTVETRLLIIDKNLLHAGKKHTIRN